MRLVLSFHLHDHIFKHYKRMKFFTPKTLQEVFPHVNLYYIMWCVTDSKFSKLKINYHCSLKFSRISCTSQASQKRKLLIFFFNYCYFTYIGSSSKVAKRPIYFFENFIYLIGGELKCFIDFVLHHIPTSLSLF